MTNFIKNNFVLGSGGYLQYQDEDTLKFVARFKHRGPVTRNRFISILIKKYSPSSYFSRLSQNEAPLEILMNDNILVFDSQTKKFILDGKVL